MGLGWRSKHDGAPPPPSGDQIENVLGRSLQVEGNLKAEGAFRVDGKVVGNVESASAVIVGESGCVHGDVRGRDVVVAGTGKGNVTAVGHPDNVASGRVDGDIHPPRGRNQTGGGFRGAGPRGATSGD